MHFIGKSPTTNIPSIQSNGPLVGLLFARRGLFYSRRIGNRVGGSGPSTIRSDAYTHDGYAVIERPPSRRTAAGLICDGSGVMRAMATLLQCRGPCPQQRHPALIDLLDVSLPRLPSGLEIGR